MKSYSGVDFVNSLKSDELTESISIEGLAKSDDGQNAFQFSPGPQCTLWLKVDLAVVSKVEFLGKLRCKDHEHAHVRLHLNMPKKDDSVAYLLANLIVTLQRSANQTGASKAHGRRPNGFTSDYTCYSTAHCGNGEYIQGAGDDVLKARSQAAYGCYNKGGVLSYGGEYCTT